MVHEFVGSLRTASHSKSHQLVDHTAHDVPSDPDIAVHHPDDIALSFTVCSADISNLGVRSQVVNNSCRPIEHGVLDLDQNFGIVIGKVFNNFLQYRVGGIGLVFDAETDRELVDGVILLERCGDTFVKMGFEAFDGPNYGDMGGILSQVWRYRRRRTMGEIFKAIPVSSIRQGRESQKLT